MRRLYFLAPDIGTTRRIVDDLLLARIREGHIHVLGRRDSPLDDLPEAGFLQKTDFVPALTQGLAVGGATGMLAGLAALLSPVGAVFGGGTVLVTSLIGAGLGAWWSSLIGVSTGSRRLTRYARAIEDGAFLIMADVPKERVPEIEERIRRHYANAEFKGTEPRIPAFP